MKQRGGCVADSQSRPILSWGRSAQSKPCTVDLAKYVANSQAWTPLLSSRQRFTRFLAGIVLFRAGGRETPPGMCCCCQVSTYMRCWALRGKPSGRCNQDHEISARQCVDSVEFQDVSGSPFGWHYHLIFKPIVVWACARSPPQCC